MQTFSALLAICAGNSPGTGEFPAQMPVTRSFGVFFDHRLNERLSKHSWGWWFETPSCPLWRHCNVEVTRVLSKYRHLWHSMCKILRSKYKSYENIDINSKLWLKIKLNKFESWSQHVLCHISSFQEIEGIALYILSCKLYTFIF